MSKLVAVEIVFKHYDYNMHVSIVCKVQFKATDFIPNKVTILCQFGGLSAALR